jgi:hypothetical protein
MDLGRKRNKLLKEIEEIGKKIGESRRGSLPILPSVKSFIHLRRRLRALPVDECVRRS